MNTCRLLPRLALLALALSPAGAWSQPAQQWHGLLDLRYSVVDGLPSYLEGGYGKFTAGEGGSASLAQGALGWRGELNEQFSLSLMSSAYAGGDGTRAGISEAALQFRGLPGESGLRWEGRAGLLYPRVSLENLTTAWTSPYTLDWSTLNAWLGEEVRHQGVELGVTRLGKFSGRSSDVSLHAALLRANDPTGAMLAWHGWVSGSRQSQWGERLPLPAPVAALGFAPEASDPFLELDGRLGWHLSAEWDFHARGLLQAGWYDNNADPKVVQDEQWSWTTRFAHVGLKLPLPGGVELIAQALAGDTLMSSPTSRRRLVDNDYHSAFVLLSRPFGRQRLSLRLEDFGVRDRDRMAVDPNGEDGRALTLSYAYRLSRHWFLQGEYTRIDSRREARADAGQPLRLVEQQLQIALRAFL